MLQTKSPPRTSILEGLSCLPRNCQVTSGANRQILRSSDSDANTTSTTAGTITWHLHYRALTAPPQPLPTGRPQIENPTPPLGGAGLYAGIGPGLARSPLVGIRIQVDL